MPTLRFLFLPAVLLACSRPVAVTTPTSAPAAPGTNAASNNTSAPSTPTEGVGSASVRNVAADTTARPLWLRQRIAAVLAEPRKPQPTIHIFRYAFRGQEVYWESAPCCDQYSTVYSLKGQVICHPDGGITGNGDGQCPDFDQKKTNERLVWQDPR